MAGTKIQKGRPQATFLNLNMPHPALISGTRNGLALEGADNRLLKIPM